MRRIRLEEFALVFAVAVLILSLIGCAARATPQLVAARAVTMMEVVQAAQRSIIAAEERGFISEDDAAAALTRIRQATIYAQVLPDLFRGWAELEEQDRAIRLDDARVVVFTLSQVLAGITLPPDAGRPIRNALMAANALLLHINDVRGVR